LYDYLCINIDTDTDCEQRIERLCHVTVSFFSKEELKKVVSGLITMPLKVSSSHAHIMSSESGRLGYKLSIRSIYMGHP
jgi:hypothetical protein